MRTVLIVVAGILLPGIAAAHESESTAQYLANEGLMVTHGNTKVLFDPLFNESFGQYRLVPEAMRRALFRGEAPWDGIDAVFISHYHDDHFAPADMLEFLRARSTILLFAPQQAVDAMRDISDDDDPVFTRVNAVRLEYGDEPFSVLKSDLLIEAVRVPHSGWPSRRAEVENIAWRITLDDTSTVLHLGDADTSDVHFGQHQDFWDERSLHMAFPPYWFFLSGSGTRVLRERLRPARAIGIHVPVTIPEDAASREEALQNVDLFTVPGETRAITHGL
jgi:L-ascorbate metabolism protein UlaG (beta-lactamase superfamily)